MNTSARITSNSTGSPSQRYIASSFGKSSDNSRAIYMKKKQNQQFELLLGCTRFALANDDIQFQSPLFCCGSPRTNGTDSTIAMCLQYQRIQYQHRRSKFLPLPMGRPLESPPKGKLSTKSKQSIIINHPYRWMKKKIPVRFRVIVRAKFTVFRPCNRIIIVPWHAKCCAKLISCWIVFSACIRTS